MKNSLNPRRPQLARVTALAVSALLAMPIFAQYPGSPARKPTLKTGQRLRSTAVLEWLGEPGKPSASRIVPVAVWDGVRYQDGGLYLAQPEPLAVQDGTEYELQRAGVPQGSFVILRPGQLDHNWFGYGMWHPVTAKKVSKLKPSKTPPTVVTEVDEDRPSFSNKSKTEKGTGTAPGEDKKSGSTANSKTAPEKTAPESSAEADVPDPDRPTLHKRGPRDTPEGSDSASTESTSDSRNDTKASGDPDPDRPTLRKQGGATGGLNTTTAERDPDRPDLHRGRPTGSDPALLASKLAGMPADLQQMAAISDPTRSEDHPFLYQWANPDDAPKMKQALEDLARRAIAGSTTPNGTSVVTNIPAAEATSSKRAARPGAKIQAARAAARKAKLQTPPLVLTGEAFNAFELSYSGGATLVLTAQNGEGDNKKDVTIIAQPDFYGVPHLLLQSVADATRLDVTPRMRLVDAADTDGDNRAELIFELRGATDRQFAIYKVAGGRAEQVFATNPLPLGTRRD